MYHMSERRGRRLARGIIVGCFMIPCLCGAAEEQGKSDTLATIEVTFTGIEADREGSLVAALFSGKKTWLEPEGVLMKVDGPVKGKTLKLKFEKVPYGESYAIQVFHDANGNGELDFRRVIPIPKEGVGVSNNHTRMGPPKYDKAEFAVQKDKLEMEIVLRYY